MTTPLYLRDTYQFQATATLQDIKTLEDGRTAIIVDQTIFYPQGGGQPCDTGTINSDTGKFLVTDVRLDKEGTVFHMGTLQQGTLNPGQQVTLTIDQDRRIKNAQLHSAGHLLDCAVTLLKLPLKPSKGYHFADGPYVEYEGEISQDQAMISSIQGKLNDLIAHHIPVMITELSSEQAQQQGIKAPQGKSARIVQFEGFEPCGCGGTHVTSSDKLGKIIIRKIKSKAGNTRISYEIQP